MKRSTTAGGPYTVIASGLTTTSFTDTGLPNGATRHYVVSATSLAGEGANSTEAAATTASPIEVWRMTHFGVTANSGNGADSADPDHDGRANLLEYATGTSPSLADSGSVVILSKSGDGLRLVLGFNRIADPSLIYQVEATDTPASWSGVWTSTGADNTAGPVTVSDPELIGNHARRFLRLRVSR